MAAIVIITKMIMIISIIFSPYDIIGAEGKSFDFPYYLIFLSAYLFSLTGFQVALFYFL